MKSTRARLMRSMVSVIVLLFVVASGCHSSKKEPAEVTELKTLANTQLTRSDIPGAIETYRKLIALQPDNPSHMNNLGQIYSMVQEFKPAEEAFTLALKVDPNNVPALINIGGMYFQMDRIDEAKANLEKAVALDPSQVKALTMLGNIAISSDKFEEAHAYLDKAIATNPDFEMALLLKGYAYLAEKRPDKAEQEWQKLYLKSPLFGPVIEQLARLYFSKGEQDKAQTLLEKSIELGVQQPAIYRLYGMHLEQKENLDEAIRIYRIAANFPAKDPVILYHLGFLILDTGGSIEEAKSFFRQADQVNPSLHVYFLDGMAWAASKSGNNDEAERFFSQTEELLASKADSDQSMHYYYKGKYLSSANRKVEARAAFEQALSKGKDSTWTAKVNNELAKLSGK